MPVRPWTLTVPINRGNSSTPPPHEGSRRKEAPAAREWKREPAGARGTLPHRLLFCGSDVGKTAFVRQLSPYLHIDSDNAVIGGLAKHITKTLWCARGAPGSELGMRKGRAELFATPNEACQTLASFFE